MIKPTALPGVKCTHGFKSACEKLAKSRGENLTDFIRNTLHNSIVDEYGDNWEAMMNWKPTATFLLESR